MKILNREEDILDITSPRSQSSELKTNSSISKFYTTISENDLDFLQFLTSDEKEYELFAEYCKKRFEHSYIEFYNLWRCYVSELNDENQKKIENLMFSKYIDSKSEDCLKLQTKVLKKAQKLCSSTSKFKGFLFVVKHVQNELEDIYDEYENYEEIKEKITIPSKSFEELIYKKKEFNLFQFHVKENLNCKNYSECFEYILKFKKAKSLTKKNELSNFIIKKYLNINKPNNCIIFNSKIRNIILSVHQSVGSTKEHCSMDILFKHLNDILSEEYYPRFLNSSIWWNYISIHSNFVHKKNLLNFFDIENPIKQYIDNDTYCLIEINEIRNKLTLEKFISKRITKQIDTIESSLNFIGIKHPSDGLIFPIEIFEEVEKENIIITYVTNGSYNNLNTFIIGRNGEYINSVEIIDIMMKILTIVRFYHEKKKYFDLNELREDNIYYNEEKVTIDQGYYNDSHETKFSYWVAPEKIQSEKNDCFSLGMILFRLITLIPTKEINDFFEKMSKSEPTHKTSIKNLMDKISSKYNNQYSNILKNEMLKTKNSIENSLFDIVLKMIDPNPSNRLSIDSALKKLGKLQSKLKVEDVSNLTNSFRSLNKEQQCFLQTSPDREYLKEFLRLECSIENILFYEDVEIFKSIEDMKEKLLKSKEMFETYLNEDSNLEINVNRVLKKKFMNNYFESEANQFISNEIFDDFLSEVIDGKFHISRLEK
eukprot:gene6410-10417_t